MHSPVINTLRRSTNLALTTAVILATVLIAARAGNTQQLQRGVGVQLAATSTASPMPDADSSDAWIVAVTADGTLFFGVDPVTPSELADKMKSRPRRRNQNLYIKADALAPFAAVRTVLTTAHEMGFDDPVLLTAQSAPPATGTMVPPQGLEVLLAPPFDSAAPVVQITKAAQQEPALQVNHRQIPPSNLQNLLTQIFKTRTEKSVLVKAEGPLSFADVVHVIDTCHSAGAKVVLATPAL
jgi:biopolymer transport protein ExbD